MIRVNTRSGEAGRRSSRAQGAGGRQCSNRRGGEPLFGHWPVPVQPAQPAEDAPEDLVVIELLRRREEDEARLKGVEYEVRYEGDHANSWVTRPDLLRHNRLGHAAIAAMVDVLDRQVLEEQTTDKRGLQLSV